ncbi:MAG: hypothetical protein GY849_09955, partial [Deltaproteobacteria bacterium]|nr:hypothetical protein [Deltaproteobacteria bacterium]
DDYLLFIDASTDRVGIGVIDPVTKLEVNGVITATGGDSDEWNTAYSWGDHSVQGYLTSGTETDPIFTAWDKSTGISITESQISDLDHFTTSDEIDPIFTAWDKSTGISITESQISDLDHFTNADETDQVWTAASANYYTKTNMQTSGQSQLHWDNLTAVPAGFADGVDDTGVDGLWTAGTGDDIYHENGNVGVGTTDVTAKLKVANLDDTQAALLVQQQEEVPLFLEATGGTGYDNANSVAQTGDGGYIVAGQTYSYGAGDYDVFLLKYDSSGTLEWAKTAGGTGYDNANSVAQTGDGGYIAAGVTQSYGAGSADVLLLKYDSSGNLTWAKTAGGTGYDYANSVAQTGDGGYIVAGLTYNYGAGDYDVLLLKYDSSGNLTWAKTAGGTSSDYAESVAQTGDGGYIAAGVTGSYGAGSYDVLLLKYDSSGNLTWAKTAGGTGYDYPNSVAQTGDGGYIVAGLTDSYGAGNYDVLLLKYDSSGNLTWAKTAGGTGSDEARSVEQTGDGGYIAAGYTNSYGAGGDDVLLLKYDSSGNLTWAKTAGGTGTDRAQSVAQTGDGGYIAAGRTASYGAGINDVLLMKTDSNGDISGCAACASASPSVSTPTPSTSTPTPSTSTPTPTTSTPTPSTSTPSPTTSEECSATGSLMEDVLVVSKEANVGVGTTSPTVKLDVNDDGIRIRTEKTPSSASDTCDKGEIVWDSDYVYVCVATDTWKRSALSTW